MSHNPRSPFTRSAAPTRVAVLSPDGLLTAMLTSLLEQREDMHMCALADADVILWDPGVESHQVAENLLTLDRFDVPTVVLLPDPQHARPALLAGAAAVLLRDRVGAGLPDALIAARHGLTVLDSALSETLFPQHKGPLAPGNLPALTAREQQVLALVAEGLSNRRIAKRLEISEHTAKFHVNRIMLKLDADTRTEAVVTALRAGALML